MSEESRGRDVTVADVALRAGVGKSTASRALGAYGSVSPDVRQRVLAAAKELNYRPNEVARAMNTGRSRTLGVIVGDIENPYFSLAMRGITDAASAAGYDVILANTSEDLETETHAVRVFLDKRVDAVIAAPSSAYAVDHLRDVRASGRPLVLLDREVPGLAASSARVHIAPAAREATATLVQLGHRRIAYLSALLTDGEQFSGFPLGISSVEDRLRGILDALEGAGIVPDPALLRFRASTSERVAAAIDELLRLPEPPTAVLASDSTIARHVMLALRERGVRVPDDLSLIVLDDFPWAPLVSPPLTVVAQPIYEVGLAAGRAALDAIEGRPSAIPPLEAKLILRSSHGPRRQEAPAPDRGQGSAGR